MTQLRIVLPARRRALSRPAWGALTIACAAAVASIGLGACGSGSSGTASAKPRSGSSASSASLNPSAAPSDSSDPAASWSYSWEVTGGYSYTGSLELYAPHPATNQYVAACGVNQQADAEIEFHSRVQNTTSGNFTGAPSMTFSVNRKDHAASVLIVTGGQCLTYQSGGDHWSLSSQALQPQATVQANGYLVVPNYYTPNAPSGDSTVLDNFFVNPQLVFGNNFQATGPGFSPSTGAGFSLSVLTNPGASGTYRQP